MSGVYIHIPFCRRKCNYCCFYSNDNFNLIEQLVECICKEIVLREEYLSDYVETIYFGGGTPSLLKPKYLKKILTTIKNTFSISNNLEITIECNPRDVNIDFIQELINIGFNRFSIGIQTFNEKHLSLLGRGDTLQHIYSSIEVIKFCKINNFNLDIIFAIPEQKEEELICDLQKLIEIKPKHISAYCLTIEPGTNIFKKITSGYVQAITDEKVADFFVDVNNFLNEKGYEHYEISNFCKKGYESKHNSLYWDTTKTYIGLGPAAHSYNLTSRQWNINDNERYIESIQKGIVPAEIEYLTNEMKLYEYILTSLRTNRGCNVDYLKEKFQFSIKENVLNLLQEEKLISLQEAVVKLTINGFLKYNKIIEMII